jgi:hypothetical protein
MGFRLDDLPGLAALAADATDRTVYWTTVRAHSTDSDLTYAIDAALTGSPLGNTQTQGTARIVEAIQEVQAAFPQIDLSVREQTERGELSLVVFTTPGPG